MSVQYLTPKIIREICENNEIHPVKKFGQNFMVDSGQIQKIVKIANVKTDDQILEIGPGLGSLTIGLLETGAKVLAVEIDKKLANLLPQTIQNMGVDNSRLNILTKDALTLLKSDLAQYFDMTKPIKLVANLPYNVATPIIITLLERFENLEEFLVLVQAEVAERLVAEPGSKIYGIPSVKLAWFGKAKNAGIIPRSAFFPVPRVDSKLVNFKRTNLILKNEFRDKVFALINLGFSARRKTLKSLLVHDGNDSEKVTKILDSLQIDPMARAEVLNITQFIEIAERL
ncbi:MAG: 16S rRNA (adenine(1518)-N(6)/adenine(1519)-N(6))-dimethyltransferase RsmA [Candidatus Ancillula sp.]|jgi:16S rRNA (adenine1518-N6/adenine1519-N6)-dimethyltransferase|nr:16S rRNA (adenine(1518)-N(6)/adenine(1519)-N(6))-dimethyltransferase RsmA [Candidatus Ancillula sp.]